MGLNSQSSSFVFGQLRESESGNAISGLSIELWQLIEGESRSVGKGVSDAQGEFNISSVFNELNPSSNDSERLEVRVFDGNGLVLAEVHDVNVEQPKPLQLAVPIDLYATQSHQNETSVRPEHAYEVFGRVSSAHPQNNCVIRAHLHFFLEEMLEQESVGLAFLNSSGDYNLALNLSRIPDGASEFMLELQVFDKQFKAITESTFHPYDRQRLRVDFDLAHSLSALSEYELLEKGLASINVDVQMLRDYSAEQLDDLAEALDLDSDRLYLLQRAATLEQISGLPSQFSYGLAAQGLELDPYYLVDIPLAEFEASINAALEDQLINEAVLDTLDDNLEKLVTYVNESVLETNETGEDAGFSAILLSAGLDRENLRSVLNQYQRRTEDIESFWDSLSASESTRLALKQSLDLSRLVGADPILLRHLLSLRESGRWHAVEDLALFELDDWYEILESLENEYEVAESHSDVEAQHDNIEGQELPIENSNFEDRLRHHTAQMFFDEDDRDDLYERNEDESNFEIQEHTLTGELVDDDRDGLEIELEVDEENDWEEVIEGDTDDFAMLEDEPVDIDEAEEDEDYIELRAEAIMDAFEEAYPSALIHRELTRHELLSENAENLLTRLPKHDFLHQSIREAADSENSLGEAFLEAKDKDAIEEIEAVERISRVTSHAEDVVTLLGSGIDSAHAIASQPKRQFIDSYGEALGGRPQAARVHAQAQQNSAASTLAMVQLLQALQRTPLVISGNVGLNNTHDRALKDIPDARTLFGSIGLCGCDHCRSVYSPAAYYVDLLRYLDIRDPERLKKLQEKLRQRRRPAAAIRSLSRFRPLDVLLSRRPDLADIPLSCENTLTPLPYIDLVNEILEARITGKSAAHDTGSTPADVLKAVPQFVDSAAYDKTREAVYPLSLPFHDPLHVVRTYLAHLGIDRRDILSTFNRDESSVAALILVERLDSSPEEMAIILQPLDQLWRHFGFETEQTGTQSFIQAIAHAPSFLAATATSFKDLIDLISTRFINGNDEIKLNSSSPDCDPEKVRISGLSAVNLTKMIRFLRIKNRIGWTIKDLDRALFALSANDFDTEVITKLLDARDLAKQLDKPIHELLGIWGPLDTFGKENEYDRLLRTRAVAWQTKDENKFKLQDNRRELAHTSDNLESVAAALLAAFRLTHQEFKEIIAIHTDVIGQAQRLNLAGISAVYRVAFLARALKLRLDQLGMLLRFIPDNPFTPKDPATTLRFVRQVKELESSPFSIETLTYLFNPQEDQKRSPDPEKNQVQSVLSGIRGGLVAALSATNKPESVSEDFLRQKLAMFLDPTLVDAAMEALDPRTTLSREKRKAFFDRHLAVIFSDPRKAADVIFESQTQSGTSEGVTPSNEAARSRRWQTIMDTVIEALLPLLRSRQMRGAVIQALSDALSLDHQIVGTLIDRVLRSKSQLGRPLIDDFYALVGTGFTGSYFPNDQLQGDAKISQLDAKLEFSWSGASPANGVPATGFSVRWRGRIYPQKKARHTFFIKTDGDIKLSIENGGKDTVLLSANGTGRVTESVSEAIQLDDKKLYTLTIEYRNKGPLASLSVEYGASPDSKQAIPTANLFPDEGLRSFEPITMSYRRLHKAALLINGFGIGESELAWLTGNPKYLDLDNLPMTAPEKSVSIEWYQRWRQLTGLYALRKQLPDTKSSLFSVLTEDSLEAAVVTLARATGWDRAVINTLIGPKGFAIDANGFKLPEAPETKPFLLTLKAAIDIHRRAGVSPETLFLWSKTVPDNDAAATIVQAVKSRYDEKRWLEVAEKQNNKLRVSRREALVDFLLPRMGEQGVKTRNQLFEYFLIDVEMSPCMRTSRIKQAISAVQTFFQRALMNLETQVPPRLIDQDDWKWLKNYRVWEANRKVFLYPENWIEPELRDDKSPQFKTLERTILQQEIKKENVESAFVDYLQSLDEVARLDVRAVWFERRTKKRKGGGRLSRAGRVPPPGKNWEEGTYHIFARTYNAPHLWFYRRLEQGRRWAPWEKLDVDIEGDHLLPVMFQNRLHLFWAEFREKSKPTPKMKKDAAPFTLGKDWEIHIAYSVYDRGHWSRKRLSSKGIHDRLELLFLSEFLSNREKGKMPRIEGSAWLQRSSYYFRASVSRNTLTLNLYRRAVDRMQAGRATAKSGERILSRGQVEVIGRFQLSGCSGELAPLRDTHRQRVNVGIPISRKRSRRRGRRLPPAPNMGAFQTGRGGRLPVPSGYRVDGTGFSPATARGPMLQMPTSTSGGMAQILSRQRGSGRGVRVLPVTDTRGQDNGMFPFFFQDGRRSYFARPTPVWIGERTVRIPVAVPLSGPSAKRFVPRLGRKSRLNRARRRRAESLELLSEETSLDNALGLTFDAADVDSTDESERHEHDALKASKSLTLYDESADNWEDNEDYEWHPDDASERRSRRRLRRKRRRGANRPTTRKPAQQRRTRMVQIRRRAHWEQRLKFTTFEHPQTCRLINTLKSGGIEKLLALRTTRSSSVGEDHHMVRGRWIRRRRNKFQREFRPSRLVDRDYPSRDIDFDYDNPYALYNWELFFHAPLQVAIRLAKDGRHEEAQRWFHFIFDPTIDVSSPAPQRYWRFAPFHENTEYDGAKRMMALLSYAGTEPVLIAKQQKVRDQVTAWWEKPFDPHTIARMRTVAYQKSVVMKYIDNLVQWGDKLFRRDSMESIQEATQLYILAGNILGPRPERVPPMVKTTPVTFRQVREKLDPFANWAVRFENHQVRRPFRISAQPDMSGSMSVLGMSTQYFCIPGNPELDKLWDTVDDRLFKIRNCMNIKGVVRQLPLFEPPIDPGMLVKAAAAGADLGSVISSLNAPPPAYRFKFLVQRAVGLAEHLRSFGTMLLEVLEQRDAEKLAALRQSKETVLREAVRDTQKIRIKQVEEELAWLALQRESIDMQVQHIFVQAQELMNPQEAAKQESLTEAQVIAGVAEGVDLAAKVMYAIPEFQTGAAGGFSSPFITAQLGGQMAGDILTAVAESAVNLMNNFQNQAEMAAAQAEYQRRQVALMHQHEVLMKERERIEKHIEEIQLKLEISNAEMKRDEIAVENAKSIAEFMQSKFTNEDLYGWMLGQISTTYFQAYKFAFDTAKLAERALQFERADTSTSFIEFSYWDSLRQGLLAGDRLLLDLRRMESSHIENTERDLEITRHISFKKDMPSAMQELLATGTCQLNISEALLDGDFPGHYFRRIKSVSMSVQGNLEEHSNVNCTLTLLDNRLRTSANASGAYPQTQDGEDSRFITNLVPVQVVATSEPKGDAGIFHLKFDGDRYLPFEGAGAISSWRIEMPQANNSTDLTALSDIILTLSYTARNGGGPLQSAARASRNTSLSRGELIPAPELRLSLRQDFKELWSKLQVAKAGQEIELPFPISESVFPGRYRSLNIKTNGVMLYLQSKKKLPENIVEIQLVPPKGSAATLNSWETPWPSSTMRRAKADVSGELGEWKMKVKTTVEKMADAIDDIVVVFRFTAKN